MYESNDLVLVESQQTSLFLVFGVRVPNFFGLVLYGKSKLSYGEIDTLKLINHFPSLV